MGKVQLAHEIGSPDLSTSKHIEQADYLIAYLVAYLVACYRFFDSRDAFPPAIHIVMLPIILRIIPSEARQSFIPVR
jgi:hypothetical protein